MFRSHTIQWTTVTSTEAQGAETEAVNKSLELLAYENSQKRPKNLTPFWDGEASIDLNFCVNDQTEVSSEPIISLPGVNAGHFKQGLSHFNISAPGTVRFENGSLHLHTVISKPGSDDVGHKSVPPTTFKSQKAVKLQSQAGWRRDAC